MRIAADPAELDRLADRLRRLALHLAGLARVLVSVIHEPALVLGGPLAPVSFAAAESVLAGLLGGPNGLLPLAGGLEWLGERLRLVAAGYRVADAARTVVSSVSLTLLAGPLVALGTPGRPAGEPTVAELMTGLERLAGLLRVAGLGPSTPWLRESTVVRVVPRSVAWTGPAPGIGPVIGRIPASTGPATVHLEQLRDPSGGRRWLVTVPGTAEWSPATGSDPFDLTGDVRLLAGGSSAGMAGVVAAMRSIGVRPGEPVMLAGHSQGGLIVAALAADPRVRREFRITAVVTSGAPLGLVRMPDAVEMLSVEHSDDPIPALDCRPNPAGPHRLTVVDRSRPRELAGGPLRAHQKLLYERTGSRLDRSADPALRAWRQQMAPFLTPIGGSAWDVTVFRVRSTS